jgi:predicted MPP superfamily phosphohydrolase
MPYGSHLRWDEAASGAMNVLLVHLSDIHIRSNEDYILYRAQHINSALRNLDYELAACFIVVSGDPAYAGEDHQYVAAGEFMTELKAALERDLRSSVEVPLIVVPGNHDCNFEGSTDVRDKILRSIRSTPEKASDEELIRTCTTVQSHFFSYLATAKRHAPAFRGMRFGRLSPSWYGGAL